MNVKFLKDFSTKNVLFQMDAIICSSDSIKIERLNVKQIMIIVDGLRYDFDINDVILM